MPRSMILATAVAVLAAGSAAFAQQGPKPITRADITAKIDASFKEIDANHDGSLNAAELQAVQAKELQAAEAQARAILQAQFKQLDTNKDGQLTFNEFAAAGTVKANQTPAQMLQALDANKDGKISADEFRAPRIGLFNRIDTNHDGVLSVDEQKAVAGRR